MGWQNSYYTINIPVFYDGLLDTSGGESLWPLWCLKNNLKSAGWTLVQSADGISVNTTGDIFTNEPSKIFAAPGTRAGDWSNRESWFIVRMPDSTLEICFWRGTASSQGMVKVSLTGFSDNTSRGIARPPDAADQFEVHGTLPTTRSNNLVLDNYVNFCCMVCDEPINGIYPFYFVGLTRAVSPTYSLGACLFFFDALVNTPVGDTTPFTFHFYASSSSATKSILTHTTNGPTAYNGASVETIPYCGWNGYDEYNDSLTVAQQDGNFYSWPIVCGKTGIYKGMSSSFKWGAPSYNSRHGRLVDNGSSLDLNPTTQMYEGPAICIEQLVVPWPKDRNFSTV
jgi:hypothetical protein